MGKMTQTEKIINIMLDNKNKKVWLATDFQTYKWFIGYEASARISDILRIYPEYFEAGRIGRFRTIQIKDKKSYKELRKMFKEGVKNGKDNISKK